MLPALLYLYPQNTQVIQITELTDEVTGSFLTGATVTATLYDQRGNVDPVLNNITMSYVNGTDATYQGTVPSGFNPPLYKAPTPQGGYQLVITAVQAGVQAQFTIPVIIKPRNQ